MDTRPIGFFDSGLGGISVLRATLRLLPDEDYVFYGDNLNAPYGDKAPEEIRNLTFQCANRLMEENVKAIVVACNTATGACIRQIREAFALPVLSVEPAIKPACALPGEGRVLMLATSATTKMDRYLALQRRMPDPERVVNVPCPGLVERIEQGIFAPDAFDDLLTGYLSPYEGMRVDALVLGCTHYIFIKEAIRRYARLHFTGDCLLFDGNAGTAAQLKRVLEAEGLQNGRGSGSVRFFTSGPEERLRPLFESLLNRPE